MILREYLYVDTSAVRGLLAQMDAGITEAETETRKSEKRTAGGFKGFVEHSQAWVGDVTTAKTLGDALFPRLEEALEAEGLLEDVSALIQTPETWQGDRVREAMAPGKIVRVTCPGWLMDSRFIASILAGFAVTTRGLYNMGIVGQKAAAPVALPPKAKVKQGKGTRAYKGLPGEDASPEAAIPLGEIHYGVGDEAIDGGFLRGIAQVARGMFAPGLHLSLAPEVDGGGAITVRLQEGRQYMDSDPDVTFARYGVGAQQWTVVGTVGHHALPSPDFSDSRFMKGEEIQRAEFARFITGLGTMLGNTGLTDLAQAPGFSLVPWAVYRTLGTPATPADEVDDISPKGGVRSGQ